MRSSYQPGQWSIMIDSSARKWSVDGATGAEVFHGNIVTSCDPRRGPTRARSGEVHGRVHPVPGDGLQHLWSSVKREERGRPSSSTQADLG